MAETPNKLSIMMFCPQFRPIIGGAERQAEKLAVALVAIGCRVKILTPFFSPDSPVLEEVNGVSIERFPLYDLSRRFPIPGVALLNIPYIIFQIVRAVKPQLKNVDVLHCHIASLQTAAAALAGSLSSVPTLCKAATAEHRSDLGEIEKSGITGHLVAWLTRLVIGTWVATTLAVSEALIRAGITPNKIVRIPNGVKLETEPCSQNLTDGARRFLYMGRLSINARRDIPTMIKAFDRLAIEYPDIELAIVGGGDLYNETKALVDSCSSHIRIHLPGFDQPEKWLTWAECFVLPSRIEGLSNALLEAMAVGLPCIANDIPPNREVLDDGKAGVLVPVEDCNALEAAMLAMIEKEGFAEHYSLKAIERIESSYSIDAVAKSYVALYGKLFKQMRQNI